MPTETSRIGSYEMSGPVSGRSGLRRKAWRLDRRLSLALVLLLCLLAFYGLRYLMLPSYAPIVGVARVIDGDTIQIVGIRIRLEGIDAPEWDQTCFDAEERSWPCGRTATQELASLLHGRELTCKPQGLDVYRRALAVCTLADGVDVNAWLVRQGWAVISGYASSYRFEQAEAKSAGRGIWVGRFELPRDWRRRHSN
jgi:endonuclease YncB( thermonuclease family)